MTNKTTVESLVRELGKRQGPALWMGVFRLMFKESLRRVLRIDRTCHKGGWYPPAASDVVLQMTGRSYRIVDLSGPGVKKTLKKQKEDIYPLS